MNSIERIQEGLFELLVLLQGISPGQLRGLSQFVSPKSNQKEMDFNIGMMFNLLRESSSEELQKQIQISSRNYEINEKTSDEILQFSILYRLFLLQKTLRELTMTQFLKFYDLIPTQKQQILQLQALQDIQQLLSQLDSETLVSLHQELSEISKQNPGTEAEQLHKMVQLNTEHFYLYEPLRFLLQLPIDELLVLQTVFPQFESIQLLQLTDFFSLGPENGIYIALDYIGLLVPRKIETDPILKQVQYGTVQQEPYVNSLYLEILEQPPQKCVYKRNVKPPPRLTVEGDQNQNDGNLFVVPLLLRCDTFEEESKLLNGNEPLRITSGRIIEFKKLKILSTSHQLNESLFALKFELRRYKGNEYETIHSVTTNPICVVSHLNLLKEPPKTRPVVTEIIPFRGPASGATRVAILGNNFVDSPTMRVRFDNLDVIPLFHGTKTLVCQTPKHAPGTVSVRVCNDTNTWSEIAGTFTFDDVNPKQDNEKVITVGHEFNLTNAIPDSVYSSFGSDIMTDASYSGGFDFGPDLVPLWQSSDFIEL